MKTDSFVREYLFMGVKLGLEKHDFDPDLQIFLNQGEVAEIL